jgi:hypothetical protein
LEEVGRKAVSVFTGFCSKHDTETFKQIENKDYFLGNKEQEFLFVYRALCREMIAKEEARNIFRYLYKEKKISIKDVQGNTWVDAHEKGLSDLNFIKDVLDQKLINKKFDAVKTLSIIIEKNCKFSVSSIFHLEYDFNNRVVNNLNDFQEKVKPLFLTIFPQKDKTYILLSYLKDDHQTYQFLKDQLVDSSLENKTKRISLLITLYCENFACSPEKWDSLTEAERKNFRLLFETTIFREKLNSMHLDPPINFFD